MLESLRSLRGQARRSAERGMLLALFLDLQVSIVNEPSGMDMSGLGMPDVDGHTADRQGPCPIGLSSHEVRPNDQHHC